MTFDPNAIRADIETQVKRIFDPPAHDETVTYPAYSYVNFEGTVYVSRSEVLPGPVTSLTWLDQGQRYPVLFRNVTSTIPEDGGVRVLINWGQTSQEYLPCLCGAPGSLVDGVLTLFAYTPANEGTIAGLQALTRLRNAIPVWHLLPDINSDIERPCYEVLEPNGPRASDSEAGSDYFTHNLTATLKARDEGSPLLH